ncbi:MAG: bifunctional hydroxymethylpyrimidine kinase/phosphomethylpyrimidine kinase [Myxococcales bacterium]|nr:bifunctional hydroxymethylpyrimidine kinase/phosphomethylpyrimidine kinase [Myxococcales bacterium]
MQRGPENASGHESTGAVVIPRVISVNAIDPLGVRLNAVDGHLLSRKCACLPVHSGRIRPNGQTDLVSSRVEFELRQTLGFVSNPTVRIGALLEARAVGVVAEVLEDFPGARVSLDPEFCDRDGSMRRSEEIASEVRRKLLPHLDLICLNSAEAGWIIGRPVENKREQRDAAKALLDMGVGNVIVTGALLHTHPVDVAAFPGSLDEVGTDRVPVDGPAAGFGGMLSALMSGSLALGWPESLPALLEVARERLTLSFRRAVFVALDATYLRVGKVKPPVGFWGPNSTSL